MCKGVLDVLEGKRIVMLKHGELLVPLGHPMKVRIMVISAEVVTDLILDDFLHPQDWLPSIIKLNVDLIQEPR